MLEHVPDPARFAAKLLDLADVLVVSVPYRWPASAAEDHLHDPVDYAKLSVWMGRPANYHIVVREPFRTKVGDRLIAVYDRDPQVGYGRKDFKDRVRRSRFPE